MDRFKYIYFFVVIFFVTITGCKKEDNPLPPTLPPTAAVLVLNKTLIDNYVITPTLVYRNIKPATTIKLFFNNAVNKTTASPAIKILNNGTAAVAINISFENSDSTIVVVPASPLQYLNRYTLDVSVALKSVNDGALKVPVNTKFITQIDSSYKFPIISDDALLNLVQKQTFKYFWDFGHPVSGLARERNTSGETVTSGGSGFGAMAIVTGISRNFITKAEGLVRMQTMVSFLKNTAQTFHGAFPHWLNGSTGAVIPFSNIDNGADIVETSYLVMGLLTARQYFSGSSAEEINLRNDINVIVNRVEWDWFRNDGQNILYWHWSPDYAWQINLPIRGWNETLVTYVLASSSTTHPVPPVVYTEGFKSGSNYINGNTYYGYPLPLGPQMGGPLFFEHYSFMGINPTSLIDASANYTTQTKNHTLINYSYCVANPLDYYGYSDSVWGLTASDIQGGYTASSPTNDKGFIAPTAAVSSLPYTPAESMAALKFYYYVLGDKLWKEYGFTDAFSLQDIWFADSFLAIDQGPIIIMIENYRTGLLWNLFTSCPEIKSGMKSLGFTAPYL